MCPIKGSPQGNDNDKDPDGSDTKPTEKDEEAEFAKQMAGFPC